MSANTASYSAYLCMTCLTWHHRWPRFFLGLNVCDKCKRLLVRQFNLSVAGSCFLN